MPSGKRKELIAGLIEEARSFRMCGPSDESDEITAVTTGYQYLLVQFKALVGPILPSEYAARLNAIEVKVDNIYSAYDAKARLDALLPEIEDALDRFDENQIPQPRQSGLQFVGESRLSELRSLPPITSISGSWRGSARS